MRAGRYENASPEHRIGVRVAHICECFITGGIESLVCDLSAALQKREVENHVLFLYGDDQHKDSDLSGLQSGPVPLGLHQTMRIDLAGIVRLRRVLLRLKPDILHCHGYYAGLACLLLRPTGIRIPILYTVHAGICRGFQRSDRLIQWVMRRCDQVTAVSDQTAASVRDFSNGAVHPMVVHNGVNLKRISVADNSARIQSRRTFGVEPNRLILTMVAALNKPKDHPTLFRAFAEALPKLGNVELWLVGDGVDRRNLEKLSNELGIASRVHFWGKRNDVGNLLLATDVFVLASHSEGLPISVVEACCAGIPVVATDVGALAELRRLGLSILLVPTEDVEALQRGLLRLAEPSERLNLACRLAEHARQLFSIERTAREYLALYRKLDARRHPGTINTRRQAQIQSELRSG